MAHRRVSSFTPMLAVLAGGIALVHVVAAAVVLSAVAQGEGIGDWTSFYAAGSMIRGGDGSHLYDFATQSAMQLRLFGDGLKPNAYPLPAFVAMILAPLTGFSFGASFFVMLGANLVLLVTLLRAAWGHLRGVAQPTRRAFVLCAVASTPVVMTVLLGQFDLFVLGAIVACYALLQRDRPVAGGAVLALALVKPHIVAAVVLLLLVNRQWRVLGAFIAVALPLLVVPALVLGAHTLVDQARLIASYPGSSTDHSVAAAMMINIRGAAVSLTGSSNIWLWLPPLVLIAAVSVFGAVKTWSGRPPLDAQSWAVALALPLLYSPHLHLQTLVLLVGAAALFVRGSADAGRSMRTELILAAYILVGALWLLSIVGVSLMFVPVLFVYRTLVRAWPEDVADPSAAIEPDAQLAA